MKSREFGVWPPRNEFGVERQKLYDEHNHSFKKERPTQPEEYASINIEEYYRVPETKDESGNPYEENNDSLSKSKNDSNSKLKNRLKAIQQVAVLAVGSVLVVTSYQAAAKQQNVPPKPPADVLPSDSTSSDTTNSGSTDTQPEAFIANWIWSDDMSSAVLELFDLNGVLLKELPAIINITEEAATCNKEGLRTYTATVSEEDEEYSDSQTEPIPPTGHDFDDGKEVILENGQKALVFECKHCHEQFTIVTSMTETD